MTKKETAQMAVELLKQEYPDAICSLTYTRPHELLIATRFIQPTGFDAFFNIGKVGLGKCLNRRISSLFKV